MKQYTARGSYGCITYDETGLVVKCEGEDSEDYSNIVRVDVAEYLKYNGELDDTDILLVGYWTTEGRYEPPCHEHRAHLAETELEYETARLARVATLPNA